MDQHPIDQGDVRPADGPPLPAHGLTPPASWRCWALLLAGWAASRFLLVSVGLWDLPYYPEGPLAFDDLDVYARWLPVLQSGALPSDDMWQYPPLSAFFFLLGGIGSNPQTALLVAIIGVDLVLTVVLARYAERAAWYWVGSGLLIGPVLVSRFDVVPTLFAVLAVLSAVRAREHWPWRTGAWAAVGTALKVWPVLVLTVVPRRQLLSAAGSFLVVLAVLLGGSALLYGDLTGFLGGQGGRGLQVEAVAALPFLVANAFGADVTMEYRYGAMEVAADGAGFAALAVTVVALAGLVWLAVAWWRGRLAAVLAPDVAFTIVAFSVVVSRVFSPQYSVWLLGLGVLCWVTPGSVVRGPVVMVAGAAVIAQVLYPSGYGLMLAGDPGMVVLQAIRVGLVVAAVVMAWYRVMLKPLPESSRPVA